MKEIQATLSKYPIKTRLSLSGTLVVARDIAHAKLKERIDSGEGLPQYAKDHIIYYAGTPLFYFILFYFNSNSLLLLSLIIICCAGANEGYARINPVGPAKTPEGYASGSFGPTTAGRMDSYVDMFMKNGGSLITLAKGNRSKQVTEGTFYLFIYLFIYYVISVLIKRCFLFFFCYSVQEVRRILPGLDRRSRCSSRAGLHQEGRGAGVPGAGHGGRVAHRGRGLPRLRDRGRQGGGFLQGPQPLSHLTSKSQGVSMEYNFFLFYTNDCHWALLVFCLLALGQELFR
jgi:tartrate dehydratase beta subunit/fumarate hydratase class I family protein